MRVIDSGKPNLEVNKTGNHFKVELVIQDQSGKTIGAMGVVFMYKDGDDKAAFQKKAEELRDEMRDQIPGVEKLFEPARCNWWRLYLLRGSAWEAHLLLQSDEAQVGAQIVKLGFHF
jgi:hypothetical protein